jgi:hypothetical protein
MKKWTILLLFISGLLLADQVTIYNDNFFFSTIYN